MGYHTKTVVAIDTELFQKLLLLGRVPSWVKEIMGSKDANEGYIREAGTYLRVARGQNVSAHYDFIVFPSVQWYEGIGYEGVNEVITWFDFLDEDIATYKSYGAILLGENGEYTTRGIPTNFNIHIESSISTSINASGNIYNA